VPRSRFHGLNNQFSLALNLKTAQFETMIAQDEKGLFSDRIRIQSIIPGLAKPEVSGLAGIVELANNNAPYIGGLISDWPDIVKDLDTKTPETILQEIVARIDTDQSIDELKTTLRTAKQQMHLLTALCDLAGIWKLDAVTEVLSAFADIAMDALIAVLAREMGFEANDRGPVPGLFVLALGKYGSRELNYSSDIDLIVFYDPDYLHMPDPAKAERTLVRFVRNLMRGFDEVTADGYVFRTDLRLRPDPRSNSVAVSTLTAERYYETLGQNWERAAMIKARVCGGDRQAGDEFINNVLTPYIWRRNLDYAAIADIHSIKRQIQADAKPEDLVPAGHDLKLGIGGIREIEFYAQVQQLILGGRHKSLRSRRTKQAISTLTEQGYVSRELCDQLCDNYDILRNLEHRVQMWGDEQTHIWSTDEKRRSQLANLCHTDDLVALETGMHDLFLVVHTAYSGLFPEEENLSTDKGSLVFTGVEPEQPTLQTLGAYGFERGPEVWQHMADWLGGRIPATRTPRARELLTRMAPRIIESCGATQSADTAFFSFAEFITGLNAGVTLFSMFVAKPTALRSLLELLATAPSLAKMLSAQPALIDAMIEPDFLKQKTADNPDFYSELIDTDSDFETALNIVRRAVHEDQFSLMASLLKHQNVDQAGKAFSGIAEAAITALLPWAAKETERLFGEIKGEYALIGMGKLGGRELSLTSDIDTILVYMPHETEVDESRYNKLTRRIITALSSTTEEGGLYEVDMALRPSGRSGPLAVRLDSFEKYYQQDAWTWEFMALSRARVVAASSTSFHAQIEATIDRIFDNKDFQNELVDDVLDMHQRLARDKPAKGAWDIKGLRGGLRDIEFIAQYLILKHDHGDRVQSTVSMLEYARKSQWIDPQQVVGLVDTCRFYQRLIQLISISVGFIDQNDKPPVSVKKLLLDQFGNCSFEELEKEIQRRASEVEDIFARIIKK